MAFPCLDHVKTVSPDVPRPRIVLFGIRCQFTEIVAARLAQSAYPPIALILPGPPAIEQPILVPSRGRQLPMANVWLAATPPDLPTYQVGKLSSSGTIRLINDLKPDLIVVACFPRLIPRPVHELARLGAVNIHPSLLPAHRGPDPLFWIMRAGGTGYGVTVHALADQFDSGDILAQRPVLYPDGTREIDLEARLANVGAELALSVVNAFLDGTNAWTRQDERLSSYESWPTDADYALDTDWPARRAWNFVRGVTARNMPISVDTGDAIVRITDAAQYGESEDAPPSGDDQVVIRFSPGWLLANVYR